MIKDNKTYINGYLEKNKITDDFFSVLFVFYNDFPCGCQIISCAREWVALVKSFPARDLRFINQFMVFSNMGLVTGGTGYIGSHTCVAQLEAGYKVIVADNLCNSKAETVDYVKQITNKQINLYQIDVTDEPAVEAVFCKHSINGIIHFAGLKAVGESVEKPLAYYYNNIVSTMILAKACQKYE